MEGGPVDRNKFLDVAGAGCPGGKRRGDIYETALGRSSGQMGSMGASVMIDE